MHHLSHYERKLLIAIGILFFVAGGLWLYYVNRGIQREAAPLYPAGGK